MSRSRSRSRARTSIFLLAVGLITLSASAPPTLPEHSPRPEIQALLDQMVHAWNNDDLGGHVAAYAEDATYTLPDGLRHGRTGVMDALRGFERDGNLLGTLRFEDVSIRDLADRAALVTGQYVLAIPNREDSSGRFTLVFEHREGTWVVVHDHSS